MPDFKGAAQAAFFQALDGAAEVTDLSDVYQHVPQETEPTPDKGLTIIGDLSAVNIAGKDGEIDRVTVEVITEVRQPDQTALTQLQAAVRGTLDRAALPTQSGFEISPPVLESEDAALAEDGQTYLGTQRFSVLVQPA